MAGRRGRYRPEVRRRIVDFMTGGRSGGLLARESEVSEHIIQSRAE